VRRRLREERGVTTLEFAVIAPVLLLILLGIIQIGIYLFTSVDVSQATRDGARQLTVSRNDPSGVQDVENAITTSVGGEVDKSRLHYSFSSPAPWAPGTTVTVTVTYPAALSVMGIKISDGPITDSTKVTVE
jgi:Flp pilus assembly protein TadG